MKRTTVQQKQPTKRLGKGTGIVVVRERGLDVEIWNGKPQPAWTAGILFAADDSPVLPGSHAFPAASSWVMALPTYLCTTRWVKLPTDRPDEIADMLKFEVPRIAPCSTQPWVWDYSVVERSDDGGSEVLVVLSPEQVVDSALKRVQALGIEPRVIAPGAMLHALPLACGRGGSAGMRAYFWWNDRFVDFFVIDGAKVVFLRGARIGDASRDQLCSAEAEVMQSLSVFLQTHRGLEELPIYAGGMNPEVPRLVERLEQTIGRSVERIAAEVSRGAPGSRRDGQWQAACINLLPESLKEKDRRTQRRRQAFVHGLRICLIVLLMLLCVRVSTSRLTSQLQAYENRMAQISPLAGRLQFLQGQLNLIQTQVQGSVSMLDVVGQLYEVLPEDVSIHYLSIDQNGRVAIRGQARLLSQVCDCIDPLERSDYLVNVTQNYSNRRDLEGQTLIDFELVADLVRAKSQEAGQ